MGAGEHDVFFQSLYGALIASMQKGQGGPFAAGVVSGGELISVGTNSVLASHDVSRHAEINALAGAGRMRKTFNLSDSILLTSHFPCLMCYGWIWMREPWRGAAVIATALVAAERPQWCGRASPLEAR